MIEQGIPQFIEYCKTIINADIIFDDKNDLYVNGKLIIQDISFESIKESIKLWIEDNFGQSDLQKFYKDYEEFKINEIQYSLLPILEELQIEDKEE